MGQGLFIAPRKATMLVRAFSRRSAARPKESIIKRERPLEKPGRKHGSKPLENMGKSEATQAELKAKYGVYSKYFEAEYTAVPPAIKYADKCAQLRIIKMAQAQLKICLTRSLHIFLLAICKIIDNIYTITNQAVFVEKHFPDFSPRGQTQTTHCLGLYWINAPQDCQISIYCSLSHSSREC